MNIGEKIKNAREDMDMSQREIASLIPMNQSNYSKIERDLQEPNLQQLKRICEILKLSPCYLLGLGETTPISDKDISLLNEIKAVISNYTNK